MTRDPAARGAALARLWAGVAPSLWADLESSGTLPDQPAEARARAREEWEGFALYACVRGLVAAGGFNRETAAAVDQLHETVTAAWRAADPGGADARIARTAGRHGEYGRIGQELGAAGAATVTARLGAAAARHLAAPAEPSAALAEVAGGLHEALAEAAADAARRADA